jgi:acyl carrier protein
MSDTLERIKKVTADVLKIDPSEVKDDSRFVQDLGAESIQSIELVAAFEEEFDIEMDEDQALGVKSVGDAVEFIDNVIKQQKQ